MASVERIPSVPEFFTVEVKLLVVVPACRLQDLTIAIYLQRLLSAECSTRFCTKFDLSSLGMHQPVVIGMHVHLDGRWQDLKGANLVGKSDSWACCQLQCEMHVATMLPSCSGPCSPDAANFHNTCSNTCSRLKGMHNVASVFAQVPSHAVASRRESHQTPNSNSPSGAFLRPGAANVHWTCNAHL